MKNLSDVKEGVWVLAVISFIMASGLAITGIQMFFLSDIVRGIGGLPLSEDGSIVVSAGQLFGVGFVLVLLAFFAYFVGRGLLKAKKWSKFSVGVVAVLLFSLAVALMVNTFYLSGIAVLAIAGLEGWYLFFNKDTKKYFK